ncbi:fibrinogen-like protein 1 [Drosophila busckii]|uniref:fibrinogen-like protein 1 n=1 Tax=Drosophila busckii TaxID=30019 RepID=UPI00143285F8|nr:fibrinogen-like protein 1 [Drosophila busckii]
MWNSHCVLSVIMLLLYMRPNWAADVVPCQHSSESSEECRTYCYKVVKPLLQYFHISSANQERFHKQEIAYKEQQTKLAEQQEALKKSDKLKDSLISEKDKRIDDLGKRIIDLDKKLGAGVEAQKETLKKNEQLQAKVNELQTQLKVQQEALKKSEEQENSLLSEKDKRIVDLDKRIANLKEQMNDMNKNKQFEDKLIKFVDRAEWTSLMPYGNDFQTITLPGAKAFQVPFVSNLPGWVVIQRRMDGSVNFNRTWEEYKNGFGNQRGEFWLGLEKLHLMTRYWPHELYIQLEDFNNDKRYARYSNFRIGSEAESYALISVGEFAGNAGNALQNNKVEWRHIYMRFSTPDRDNDNFAYFNCAADYASGWWFNKCFRFNPNGLYVRTNTDQQHDQAIRWLEWQDRPLKFVQMMIRPTNS